MKENHTNKSGSPQININYSFKHIILIVINKINFLKNF